jgi:hypothetical protein
LNPSCCEKHHGTHVQPLTWNDKGGEAIMAASQGDSFKIGFALCGAISAGAYTAGVLDYFFQALNAWENARGGEGVPEA